jgi:hypothetical protein
MSSPMVSAILNAPCGHTMRRTADGQYYTALHEKGQADIEVIRPTFDESVAEALSQFHARKSEEAA